MSAEVLHDGLETGTRVRRLLEELAERGRAGVTGVCRAARGWLAAALVRSGGGPLLWVCASEEQAERRAGEARLFLGENQPHPLDPAAARVAWLPLHGESPYRELAPDRDAELERLAQLARLVNDRPPELLVASLPALLRRGMPRGVLAGACELLVVGETIDLTAFAEQLVRLGYLRVPMVEDPGTFAIRGGIVDIFVPGRPLPVRLELLGDEIESIRAFSPDTQRTVSRGQALHLVPAREILWDEANRRRAARRLERLGAELDLPSRRLLEPLRDLRAGRWFFGVESLLPAFYDELQSPLDFLPGEVRLVLEEPAELIAVREEQLAREEEAYREAAAAERLAFAPAHWLLDESGWQERVSEHPQLVVGLAAAEPGAEPLELACRPLEGLRRRLAAAAGGDEPLGPLLELLADWRARGLRPVLLAADRAQLRELESLLGYRGIASQRLEDTGQLPSGLARLRGGERVLLAVGELAGGFTTGSGPGAVAFLPAAEIFGSRQQARPRRRPPARPVAVKPGDYVVHADHGIGLFERIERLRAGGGEGDFLRIAFRGGDHLYLPVTRLELLDRYRGPGGRPPQLSKLGGTGWERTKTRIKQSLLEMADELLRTEAARQTRGGEAVSPPGPDYHALAASFPFEETEDQQRAIAETVADLCAPQPMDRLVCGDVGFGKTEVAVRAAYLHALDGRQTAVLVPTTILALQHWHTFRERLAGRGVRVEMLSRLVPRPRQRQLLQELAAGGIEVMIGTHRLLQDDVQFSRLGLLVIDEEQRFGVRHKERLKKLRARVDVLTLTATPLPRTLEMALSGLRRISVIHTPPAGRRSIRTIIARFGRRVIAEAIGNELDRGGQVFVLHNWVRSLPAMERFLRRLVPRARVVTAHGQMSERQLESVMAEFVERRAEVLLCTSIIESGLDIPAANTIIINRADLFGLAQLHQIRGRVGRARRRAYAYLLVPGLEGLSAAARRRLEVLSEHSELGAGWRIAYEDMELRGAGNLLGRAQSGHLAAVGYDLYSKLLERAVAEARGQVASEIPEPELQLPVAGLIPDDYLPELEERLEFYGRISRAADEVQLRELEGELEDRYGPLPREVETLLELTRLKLRLRELRARRLELRSGRLTLELDASTPVRPERLVELAQRFSERLRLEPPGRLVVTVTGDEGSQPLALASHWLGLLEV